ncbi:MAG: lipopolysaccharide biosynthesis protein [Verrucomicrobia bacterium]|nr:lipopolysaccharide biosynthesis protein [Verrucomicrobiota bacterium]
MSGITKKKIVTGLGWNAATLVVTQGSQMLVKLVLAAYLLPEHFGVMGMAIAACALVTVCADMGIGAALIQRNDQSLTPKHWNSAYWFNLAFSWIAFAVLALVVAPLAGMTFKESLVSDVVIANSASLLWLPLSYVHRIRLQKSMRFKPLFTGGVFSCIAGGAVGIWMAMKGYGVWSFVGQGLAASLVQIPVYRTAVKWRPANTFSMKETRELMSFGLYDAAIRLVGYAFSHLNVVIVGLLLTPAAVGFFTFAQIFTVSVINPINRLLRGVFFPAFSGIQSDRPRIKRYHLAQIKYVCLIIFPFATGVFLFARVFLTAVWGDKWADAVFPVQMLSLFIIVLAAGGTPAVILKSIGHIRKTLLLQCIRFFVIKIPFAVAGGYLFDLSGFVVALVVSQVVTWIVDYAFVARHIDLRIADMLRAVSVPAVASLTMVAALFGVLGSLPAEKPLWMLAIVASGGMAVYALALLAASRVIDGSATSLLSEMKRSIAGEE